MKNLFIIILILFSVLSACKNPPQNNNTNKNIDNIVVPYDFNWQTTKDINIEITLPYDIGLMRTKILSPEGIKLFYKGYPIDTTTRLLKTKITIPSYLESLKLTNGITEELVDFDGDALFYDFNNSYKNLKALNDDCGECDGQITELELEYQGTESNPLVKVTQKKGSNHNYVIFEDNVQGPFSFIGANNHNKMGSTIKVYVNNILNVEIHTSCSVTILAGMVFGDFEIISGISDNGGNLCSVDGSGEDDSYLGSLVFEDLYPGKGDYDFNDLVIDYNFDIYKTDNEIVDSIKATFIIKAFGASFKNGFGFQFPSIDPNDITSVTGYSLKPTTIFDLNSNGTEANQSKATFIAYDDPTVLMLYPGSGIGVNTTPGVLYVEPDTIVLHIIFEPNTITYEDLDIGNFNPFIVINENINCEVHLTNHEPTDLFDLSLFGTFQDDSDPSIGRYFLTENNLPWAINIPENLDYVIEKTEINLGYLKFIEWAESGGTVYEDWYKNISGYRDDSKIYQKP